MEFNVSSFYEGEESGKHQLNSTAFEHDVDDQTKENGKKEWKLSPIVADASKSKPSIFRKIDKKLTPDFKSPLRTVNVSETSTSGYESKSTTDEQPPQSSTEGKLSMSAELSSFIANNSLNPFDSILLNSLHKSINFSPRVVFSQEACSSSQQDAGKFQWSVEQLAILKPAHISEDEIAASYRSPVPEVEEKIQEALNEYWANNVSYIPSPDGPRFVHLPHRDGSVTTFKYGEGEHSGTTPSLCNIVRKKEAAKAAYATSSPKQRPRRNLRQARSRSSQTELTIPPSVDLDLKKLLGEQFVYQKAEEEEDDDDEVFNVSVCSNVSTRRRLFSSGTRVQDDDRTADVANVSVLSSADEQFNESQPFNDSLSPVRQNDEECLDMEPENESSSAATRSHVSQIAINISILNDCMMNSIDEDEGEEADGGHEEEEHPVAGPKNVSSVNHLHENEYEMCDRSASTNATPRHEDLDWTPRRIDSIGKASSASNSARQEPAVQQADFRRFMFDMSPIHPHGAAFSVRTPIQRCHLTMPREFNIDDDLEEEEEGES